MSPRHTALLPALYRFATTAVCWGVCAADNYGFLVYHPSGRPETTYERVMHGLLGPGLFLIGCLFAITGSRRLIHGGLPVGLCAKCGYDLRATPDLCPECGHAATPSDEPRHDVA